jgi:hypothetical protein
MNVSDNNEEPKHDLVSPEDAVVEIDSNADSQERLRKLLADLELTPEQTRDDIVVRSSRDQEFLDDVPPHHG